MSNPPQDPGSAPRLRARARVGGSPVRPEVADALGQVERSLSEVTSWERALAEPGAEREPLAPPVPSVLPPPIGDEAELTFEPTPAAQAPLAEGPPLLTEFARPGDAEPEDDEAPTVWSAGPAVAAAATPPLSAPPAPPAPLGAPGEPEVDPEAEMLQRRRRNGRILSWAGVVVLLGVAALWLIPDRSEDPETDTPALEETTTSRRAILDPVTTSTTTTVPPTVTTVAAEPTATTAAPSGGSGRSGAGRTTTTRAAAPTPPPPAPTTPTLPLPGDRCPAGCPQDRTTTTRAAPPPPTTTPTTAAPDL